MGFLCTIDKLLTLIIIYAIIYSYCSLTTFSCLYPWFKVSYLPSLYLLEV